MFTALNVFITKIACLFIFRLIKQLFLISIFYWSIYEHKHTALFQWTFYYCFCTISIIIYYNDNTFLDLYAILFWLYYIKKASGSLMTSNTNPIYL